MNRRKFLAGSAGVLAFFTGCIGDSPSGSSNSSLPDNPTEPSTSQTLTTSRSPSGTSTSTDELFQIESKYTEPQKIISVNHQGVVDTRNVSYRDSTRKADSGRVSTEISVNSTDVVEQDTSSRFSEDSADSIQIWNNSTDARPITITIEVTDRPTNPLYQETYVEKSPENPILNKTYTINPDAYIIIRLLKPGDYVVGVGVPNQDTVPSIKYTTDNCNMQSLSIGVMPDGSVDYFSMSTMRGCMVINTTTTAT
jgi:hypothetical protein